VSSLKKKIVDLTRYVMLPLLLIVVVAITLELQGTKFARVIPHYGAIVTFFAMITIERVYSYKHAVSQRHMIWRDLMSTAVQTLFLGALVGAIVLPVLHYFPNTFLGHRFLFATSNRLGPLWVQVVTVFLLSSCWEYWVHRLQHYNGFLWKLHGYHHGVSHLQASNIFVSHPLDFALRNLLGVFVLSIVGFNPIATVIAGANMYGYFSHSGADMRGGWLNYFFNTPEVHRWHHSVAFPDDKKLRHGCNFGVGVSFWDILFGTFYLPKDEEGHVVSPRRLGHPEGYPDEPNYLKMLLAVRAFPALERLFGKSVNLSSGVSESSVHRDSWRSV
jgi:sterol desaturase/sphingolipid hydroxylase (fatty acid hydroxylase superfamily)